MKRSAPMKRSGFRSQLRVSAPAKAEVKLFNTRKCRIKLGGCGAMFRPSKEKQIACGQECAEAMAPALSLIASQQRAKDERKADNAQRDKLKTRGDWLKTAQRACNDYIRARDADQPCISCGCTVTTAWHAGHFHSTAARPDLRLDTANIHKQCVACNLHLHGNLIEYARNLPGRIGQAEVDRLAGPATAPKATADVLQELTAEFKRMKREIERSQG